MTEQQAAVAPDFTALLDRIERVCAPQLLDPYAQRHHFWMNHVRNRRADP